MKKSSKSLGADQNYRFCQLGRVPVHCLSPSPRGHDLWRSLRRSSVTRRIPSLAHAHA